MSDHEMEQAEGEEEEQELDLSNVRDFARRHSQVAPMPR